MTRIIAGSAGGRRLRVPVGRGTRPTTDRVREALFSAVVAWADRAPAAPDLALDGLAVADLYAGSGAVGLEAASRGAGPVLLVEANPKAARAAAANAQEAGLKVQLATVRVERWVAARADRAYDVVFADPPYDLAPGAVDGLLSGLLDGGWLTSSALVVVERSSRSPGPAWPPVLAETWERRYGETTLHFGAR